MKTTHHTTLTHTSTDAFSAGVDRGVAIGQASAGVVVPIVAAAALVLLVRVAWLRLRNLWRHGRQPIVYVSYDRDRSK